MFTIGIVVAGQTGVFAKFSENKIKAVLSLIPESTTLIEFFVKQTLTQVEDTNRLISENKTLLFENNHFFDQEYFSYLNRYSNNLIRFSKPVTLFDAISIENVNKLFSLFVDSEVQELKSQNIQEEAFIRKIETKLISRVNNRVHTKIWFDDKIIPSLYFRFQMDCIGLNGVFTGAKSLYFNKSQQTIHTQVSDYVTLITEIEKKFNKESGNNFYLIADEPERNTKDHLLWEKVRSLQKIKVVTSEDTE